jgi:G:T-mismatch repair DNA endonuclease (very short patch repair protein)
MSNTEQDMKELVAKAFKVSDKATIILSTVLASNNEKTRPGANGRVTDFNVKIRNREYYLSLSTRNLTNDVAVVKDLQDKGQRIILAEMNNGFIEKEDLVEGIHPNNVGYKKMAAVWEAAILEAREKRMLQEAEETMRIS